MRRITYTSNPEAFDSGLVLTQEMSDNEIESVLHDFEKSEDCELVVYFSMIHGWRVSVCNKDIVYGFHCCAYNDFERFQALNRGTPF